MKNQALFFSKDKSKRLKCYLLQFLFGALRVKTTRMSIHLMSCSFSRIFFVIFRFSAIEVFF